METKYIEASITKDADGSFTAIASTNSVDRHGEIVDNNGWELKSFKKNPVILWAHDRQITYEYTGEQDKTQPYCAIPDGSMIVDPWRKLKSTDQVEVVHYGNTRNS